MDCEQKIPGQVCPVLEEAWGHLLVIDQERERLTAKKAGRYLAFIRHHHLEAQFLEWDQTHAG